ncbi:hypothetical protein GCK72_001451 [Caenorhabditis remanei]|uniref:Uncharacterized protein n=1 Tax=Caenorhabditis remanei TaxID=31234 RepID=A0A6A5HSK0_CAERE|nr:hypothetical protein GCK72_001451 [Caenorhabditis remanei]KAF1769634.1 hypothetical protein GCK72_001451 [Caenorhabditis remanei]
MPEEYIMSSKASVYVLGGENTAALFDLDGVYVLDGGLSEKSPGFITCVREVTAVILSAPTLGNLGTTAALLEKDKTLPILTNTKPLKSAKPGSSAEVVKAIQEANSKLISNTTPTFDPKYPAHILYQSLSKGILSLYILAGDAKDAEAITKALASGNETEVEKAASEHGTIGVMLWRPAEGDKPVVRVLISGTASLARIQQSLEKAAKALPFLNAATVKSKDALASIPPPSIPRALAPSKPAAGAKPAATKSATTRPTTSGPSAAARPASSAPRALTSRAPAPISGAARPVSAKPAAPGASSRTGAPAKAPAPSKPAARAAPSHKTPAATKASAPAKAPVKPSAPGRGALEPAAQKKTVGKVQGAAPSKKTETAAPAKESPAPAATIPAAAITARVPEPSETAANTTIVLDDSLLDDDHHSGLNPMDIVVIPPTPEPPRDPRDDDFVEAEPKKDEPKEEPKDEPVAAVEPPKEIDDVANLADVEDEIPQPVDSFKKPEPTPSVPEQPKEAAEIPKPDDVEDKVPEPIDAFKKPEPTPEDVHPGAYPKLDDVLADFDPLTPSHPEPSAPDVPSDHVIIATPDPNLPDIAAAIPFIPPTPLGPNDGLIQLEDDSINVAPGFEEPLIPQAPREDGTLADCSEELSKLVEISMDTDKSTEAGAELAKAIGDVTQLSAELQQLGLDEKTDEYVRKLSNQMIEDATLPFTSALASSIVSSNGSTDQEPNGHVSSPPANGVHKEIPKHDLMQSRSSVIENGAPVEYEKTDPALDDILNACAQESDKLDASHPAAPATTHTPETLHMPAAPGTAMAPKPVKFTRPYYFDLVTAPRNEKLETTATSDGLQEFISKIRSRNVILASKDISGEQLQGVLTGKQMWCESGHQCIVIPTHSSPVLLDFRQKNEEQFHAAHLTFTVPVEKQRTTVSSDIGSTEYELAKISLE